MPRLGNLWEKLIPWKLVKRGIRREIITPLDSPQAFAVEAAQERRERKAAQATPLIRALGLAHYWQRLMDEGKFRTITDIAAAEGMDLGQASKIVRLAQLAPGIIEACLVRTDNELALEHLVRRKMPGDWQAQWEELDIRA